MVETVKYASISIDEVIAAKLRLEASVFNVEAKKSKEVLKNCKWEIKTVCGQNSIATSYHRGRFKRIFVEKSNYPIFQPSQILELYPKPYKYISELTNTDINALRVKKGQILMSCSGTIGKCTLTSKVFDNQILSHDLLRINAKDQDDIGFIYVYLITDIGQNLIKTNNYGAVIQHIEPEHLEYVQIPYPSKILRDKIGKIINRSFELRDQSNDLIDEAEKTLIQELQLPPIEDLKPNLFDKESEVRSFSIKLDWLNNRFDASYHNPIVSSIIDFFLDNAESTVLLKTLCNTITKPNIFKRIYVDDPEFGILLIGNNDFLQLNPNSEKYLAKNNSSMMKVIKQELSISENDILFSARGTIGNCILCPKHFDNFAISDNVIKITSTNKLSGYIYVFLNSDYGKELSRREIFGAVIDAIDPNNVGQIPIPILKNKDAMKSINELALKANKLRSEAYYLEQEAIRIMNEEVIYAGKE